LVAVPALAAALAGCKDRVWEFGAIYQPVDGSAAGTGGSDFNTGLGGQAGGQAGAGGRAGAGGAAGTGGAAGVGGGGAGGTGGGVQTCDPNSPDRKTDVSNCGTCFHSCLVPNANPTCTNGVCGFTCFTDFYDADGNAANGCECVKTNNGVEVCDGIDNNCNGVVDEGYDFANDENNCGGCNVTCAFPFATATCVNSKCVQGPCLPNFYDRDPNIPGCETECIKTNNGVEVCDGIDNDCDGVVDNNLGAPTVTCLSNGVCAGIKPACQGQNGWVCNYPTTYEVVEDTKFGCDGLDNDCNGLTDEPFLIGKACVVGSGPCAGTGTWVCDNTMAGNHRCMGSMKTPGTEICNGLDDDCDGLVDELDSLSNRTADDLLVYIPSANVTMYGYEASRYDATATSAGFDSTHRGCSVAGKLPWANVTMSEAEHACELLGPKWRLCTAAEWQAACQGISATTFPYGNTYVPGACNGNDYMTGMGKTPSTIPTGSATACLSIDATKASTTFSVNPSMNTTFYDMSGNVKEWAITDLTTTKPPSNPSCTTPPCLFEMRGGAYDINSFTVGTTTSAPGLQCNASISAPYSTTTSGGTTTTQGIDVRLPSVGFRCCLPGMLPP
jgi:hypothetical protein